MGKGLPWRLWERTFSWGKGRMSPNINKVNCKILRICRVKCAQWYITLIWTGFCWILRKDLAEEVTTDVQNATRLQNTLLKALLSLAVVCGRVQEPFEILPAWPLVVSLLSNCTGRRFFNSVLFHASVLSNMLFSFAIPLANSFPSTFPSSLTRLTPNFMATVG